jgi:hypothetical protein
VNRIVGKGFFPEDRADQLLARLILTPRICFGHESPICCVEVRSSLRLGFNTALRKLD